MGKVLSGQIIRSKTNNRYDVKIVGTIYNNLESKTKRKLRGGDSGDIVDVVFPDGNSLMPFIQGKSSVKYPTTSTSYSF